MTVNTVTQEAMQRELKINQAIDAFLNKMLRQMQELVDDSRIWESKMELNQLQNLLAVAQDTGSVEVVKNYIRYQIGRDNNNSSWRRRVGSGPTFGDQIIGEIDWLRDVAEGIVSEKKGSDADANKAWMTLARLYLGYLRRYFYYQKRIWQEASRK